ncbi:MAG TPA: hypothetical protein VMW16_05195 [Sedimentisphaerales bacterium]|nr:hypothetical protein [Sedimentisphaerales bacterium]
MAEENANNLSKTENGGAEQLDKAFSLAEAWPVCPKCLTPCHPRQNYCSNCDSNQAINPLATYMPLEEIRFNYGGFGIMWRKVWYDKETAIAVKLLYCVVLILFAPIIFVLGLPVLLTGKIKDSRLQKATMLAVYSILILLLISWLIHSLLRPGPGIVPGAAPYVP